MSLATTKILVVDDHELVRKGLIDLINAEPDFDVVGQAGSYSEAIEVFANLDVDIAVLDVRLPDGNGVELCRDLRDINPGIKVLMLTSFLDDEAILGAALGGASGYVVKDIKNLDLLETIRRVSQGEILLKLNEIATVTNRLRKDLNPASEIYELTDQEQKVLEFIGQGMTNRQISEAMFLAEKTIKNYVSSLLSKLGFERRTQAAALAVRLGLNKNRS